MAVINVSPGSGDNSHKAIGDALKKAKPGDVLSLAPGVYEELVVIQTADITIQGSVKPSRETRKSCVRVKYHSRDTHTDEEKNWNCTIDIRAPGVSLLNLCIEGEKKKLLSDWGSAVLISDPAATNVTINNCLIRGEASLGIQTCGIDTLIHNCDVVTQKSAVTILQQPASACIRDSILESRDDFGIWLRGSDPCRIQRTKVSRCGHNGIFIQGALPVDIEAVQVKHCRENGIEAAHEPFSQDCSDISQETIAAISQGVHSFRNVSVEKCALQGLHVHPGVQVGCVDCEFVKNGASGIFFEGPEREDAFPGEVLFRRDLARACSKSIVHGGRLTGNGEYGVEVECSGTVKLRGRIDLKENRLAQVMGVSLPSKKRRCPTGTILQGELVVNEPKCVPATESMSNGNKPSNLTAPVQEAAMLEQPQKDQDDDENVLEQVDIQGRTAMLTGPSHTERHHQFSVNGDSGDRNAAVSQEQIGKLSKETEPAATACGAPAKQSQSLLESTSDKNALASLNGKSAPKKMIALERREVTDLNASKKHKQASKTQEADHQQLPINPHSIGNHDSLPNDGIVLPEETPRISGAAEGSQHRRGNPLQPESSKPESHSQMQSNGTVISMEGSKSRTAEQIQADFDRYRDKIPQSMVTAKAGVAVPKCWPPWLMFIGENNVAGWPAIQGLHSWYLVHKVEVNENVRIKPSPGRDLGCFANKDFKKGNFVGVYSGNLRQQQTSHDSQYVAQFQLHGRQSTDEWEIDAAWGGNELRFANYPNADEEVNIEINCRIRSGHQRLVFTATKDIKKGEELLWDYGDTFHAEMK